MKIFYSEFKWLSSKYIFQVKTGEIIIYRISDVFFSFLSYVFYETLYLFFLYKNYLRFRFLFKFVWEVVYRSYVRFVPSLLYRVHWIKFRGQSTLLDLMWPNYSMSANIKITLQTGSPDHPEINQRIICQRELYKVDPGVK